MTRKQFLTGKTLRSLLIVAAGCALTYLQSELADTDFGPLTPLVTGLNSALVAFVRNLKRMFDIEEGK